MNYIHYLNHICKQEEELEIYELKIGKLPIWCSVYRKFRDRYIEDECGRPPLDNHVCFNLKNYTYSTLKSAFGYLRYILFPKKVDSLIYGFARLENIEGDYVDKFCDALINQTDLKKSYLYMERGRSGVHLQPRVISNILWIEFIDNFALIGGKLLAPILYKRHKKIFDLTFEKARRLCRLNKIDEKYIVNKVGMDLIRIRLTILLLKRLKVRQIFSTTLRNKPYLILAANSLGIKCFELQHGITEGPTPMYSGKYIEEVSPTAFLAFGKTSMKSVFNVPLNKMVNIGFAYKNFLHSKISEYKPKNYLFVSDPEITQKIINVACIIKMHYPTYHFSIRFHPMEKATPKQQNQLKTNLIEIVDNHENSSLAIMKYEGIIGEASSVLYEALSMGRKAAKIHFEELNTGINESDEQSKGFFLLNGYKDFETFAKLSIDNISIPEFYSDFKPEFISNLIK